MSNTIDGKLWNSTNILELLRRYRESANSYKGLYGVEIEMEGHPRFLQDTTSGWSTTRDGSLRGEGALEFVMRRPESLRQTAALVNALYADLVAGNSRLVGDSMRAGVHVHVNFQHKTVKELFIFMALYYSLEIVLTERFGEERNGNLFCRRLIDADDINTTIMLMLTSLGANNSSRFMQTLDNRGIRYSALNLASLAKFGSLELRAMQTPASPEPIIEWLEIIDSMVTSIGTFSSPADVMSMFSANGERNAMESIFRDKMRYFAEVNNLEEKIREGMRAAQFWVFSNNWPTN